MKRTMSCPTNVIAAEGGRVTSVHTWDSACDAIVLDARTAAVLALGECYLAEWKGRTGAISNDEWEIAVRNIPIVTGRALDADKDSY